MNKEWTKEVGQFTVSGTIVMDDWEGDPSVPGGTRRIPAYVNDTCVRVGKVDVTEDLYGISPPAVEELEKLLICDYIEWLR